MTGAALKVKKGNHNKKENSLKNYLSIFVKSSCINLSVISMFYSSRISEQLNTRETSKWEFRGTLDLPSICVQLCATVFTFRSPLIAQKHKRKCRQAWIISADWQIAESQMLFEKDSKWIVSISTGSVPSITIPNFPKCSLCSQLKFSHTSFFGRRIMFKDGKILLRRL